MASRALNWLVKQYRCVLGRERLREHLMENHPGCLAARAREGTWGAARRGRQPAPEQQGVVQALEPRVMLAGGQELEIIGVTALRKDPRFVGIDGRGNDIVVIDTAFDTSHKEFTTGGTSRIAYSYDFADQDDNVVNVHSNHGTHVSGIAAGNGGIAPGARLILLKHNPDGGRNGLDNLGDQSTPLSAATVRALKWIEDNRGKYQIAAVNMSFGSGPYAVTTDNESGIGPTGPTLTSLGNLNSMLLLGAAGNSYITDGNLEGYAGAGVNHPGAHSRVAAVSASYEQDYPNLGPLKRTYYLGGGAVRTTFIPQGVKDQLTYFSNRDPSMTDLVAPGYKIWGPISRPKSVVVNGVDLFAGQALFNVFDGTSVATPIVAGASALLQQVALEKYGARLPATGVDGSERNLLDLMRDTAERIQDQNNGEFFIDSDDPAGTPGQLMPTTGATYRRLDVRRAAERILEWVYGKEVYTNAPTAIEFNQYGKFTGQYNPTAKDEHFRYVLASPAASTQYDVKVFKPGNDRRNLPPAVIVEDPRVILGTVTVRAPHSRETVRSTLRQGVHFVTLRQQVAPIGAYNSYFEVTGPRPDANHRHTARELGNATSDGPYAASIGVDDRTAHYFTFVPESPNGLLRVRIPTGSALVPVLSVYDGKGNLLPNRTVGTNANGATLNFAGLKVGARYSVRVGSFNYATSGAFRIHAEYTGAPAPVPGGPVAGEPVGSNEAFDLASGPLNAGELAALRAGISAFGRLAERYGETAEPSRELPLLGMSQRLLADVGGTVAAGFVNPLLGGLSGASSVEDIQALLEGLETTLGELSLFAVPSSVGAFTRDGVTTFTVRLEGTRLSPVSLKLAGVSGNNGTEFVDGTTTTAETTYRFDLELGVKSDASLAAADRATVKVNEFGVETRVLDQSLSALVRQGLADGVVVDGTLDLVASLLASIHRAGGGGGIEPEQLTATELDGTQIGDLVTNTASGALTGSLPLDVTIGEFNKSDAVLELSDTNVYDTTAPAATKQNWGDLDLFADIGPAELLSAIQGLQAKVKAIASLPAINTPIPFTDGQTLSQLLGIDELLVKVNAALSTAEGVAKFVSSGDLVTRVMQMLDIPYVWENYNPATQELWFEIDYSKAINVSPNFRADVQTSILKLAAQADVDITASLGFNLKFGVDLSPPQAGDTILSRFFVDDGRLDAGLRLTVSDIAGSAKLFDFLGVGFNGGTGEATASIGFDLFGGERVTLADIGRSVTNGGAAITGANPVPAAIGNLNYTGSGFLDLGTPTITGFSGFVPSAASKIKVNLPDFKNPVGLVVDTAQLGELLDFQNLSFDDLVAAIRNFVAGLRDKLGASILGHKIPGTGKSIRELVDFVDKLADAVQSLQQGEGTTLDAAKDLLQQRIRAALGLSTTGPIVSLDLSRVDGKKVISMRLTSSGSVGTTIPFNLDVDELLGGGSVGGLPGLVSSFVDASAAGSFTFDGSYNFALGFGVDLSSPLEPAPFVTDDSGFTLTAKVSADQTLQATLGVGPLAIYVKNGSIKLTNALNETSPASYAFALPDAPEGQNGRIPLDDALGQITDLDDRLTLNAAVDVKLPMFGPTEAQPLSATGGDPRGNVFTVQVPSVSAFFGGASPTIYSPDIASLLGGVNFTAGLGSLLNGLDLLLDNLSKLFKGQMFGIDLPIIGDKLKNSAAVAFIDDIRAKFAQVLGTPAAVASEVRDRLQSGLTQLGLTGIVVNYMAFKMVGGTLTSQGTTVDADTVQILFNLSGNGTKVASVPIAFKKSPFPGVELEVRSATGGDPTVDVDVAYALNLKFGVNKDDGFFFDTSSASELAANAFVRFNGTPVLGGSLGFLKLSATNDTSQTTSFPAAGPLPARNFNGTVVGGTFSANLKPLVPASNRLTFEELTRPGIFDQDLLDYTLAAKAKMALKATLGTEGSVLGFDLASLPKLTADFLGSWDFSASDAAPAPSGSPNTLRFSNVRMDVGDFLSRQVRPVLASLEKAIAPLRPAIDLFQIALPVINDVTSLRKAVDLNHDGRATLRDLVQAWSGGTTPALQFLDMFTSLDNLYNSIESLAVTPNLLLNLGNFDVIVGPGGATSLAPFGALPGTVDAQLNALGTSATANAAKQFRSIQSAYAGANGGRFVVPLYDDWTSALGLIIGKDVELVRIDFPKLEFGVQFSKSFPIFPAISVEVAAHLKGFADFGIGYDTRGFRQYRDSGYSTPSLLANGFFLRDKKEIGGTPVDVQEFGFSGGIDLYAGLDVFVASFKVGGGIDAELYADLRDPNNDGRINLDEFTANFGPGLFDMYGQITAGLKAKAKIGFWPLSKTYTKKIATVTLVDFNTGGGNIGTLSSGTLTLTGTAENDFFTVRHISGDANTTAGEKVQVSGSGGTKIFDGVRRISFNGGAGDDRVNLVLEEIDANEDGVFEVRTAVNAPATLIGGDGDDMLAGGDGNDSIDGGAGDDEIAGSYGNDTILGGEGNDAILGGAGNDNINAGGGNDDVDAGLGNDTALGVGGDDTIAGGGGADSVDGGDGNDELLGDDPDDAIDPGPVGNDTVLGGTGGDVIAGGGGNDSVLAGAGADTVQGDDGNDTIDGGADDDSLAGNGGSDSILGGAGNDTLLGHSGRSADAGVDDDRLFGNDGNDSVDAGLGADRVEGGLGADTILGGAGNDTLIGGTGAAGTADASADSIIGGLGLDWVFGDDGTVSTANVVSLFNPTTGGADWLDGGDDNDTVYGQAGADQVSAGRGNDCVLGGDGDDSLLGQDGNDTVLGEAGADQIQGFAGADSLVGGDGGDQILGGTGNDSIQGGLGNDDLYGNEDVDLVHGNSGIDTIQGGGAGDSLVGGGGVDVVIGHSLTGIGDDGAIDVLYGGRAVGQGFVDPDTAADAGDTVAGQGGGDVVFGEEGDDALTGGDGNDSVDGGAGNDVLRGDAGDDTLLGQGNDDVMHGGAGADSLAGATGNDRILGDAGNDTLLADVGNDRAEGGVGDDSVLGGDGNDTLLGDGGVDTLRGEVGNDWLDASAGGGELLEGGAGDDAIRGSTSDVPGDVIAGGDGRDTIYGLGGGDTIDAGAGDDWVDAGAGGDQVTLGDGNDTLYAGEGADAVDGGVGADAVYGEQGNDTLQGGAGGDLLDGGQGVDSLTGGAGDDDLRAGAGSGDQLLGEAGHDILSGSDDGADVLDGGDGDDQLNGRAGNDSLRGQAGADVIDGGAGDDLAEGGAGADVVLGGRDHDVLYGHTQAGTGDDAAIDTVFGDLGSGGDDAGAGRDRLLGGGGFDVLYGEGADDFIADFGQADTVFFGAGDGASPNDFVAPTPTGGPNPSTINPPQPRGPALPAGVLPQGRWTEFAGSSAGGSPGTASGATAIVVDAANRRYVAWSDPRNGNPEIYVARHDGTSWTQLGGSPSAGLGGISNSISSSTQPSITLDGAGNPIVAWVETTGAGASNVYAARFDGAAWVAIGTSLSGGGISGTGAASEPMVVNTAAGPAVAWIDSSGGTPQVYLKRFDGTSWVAAALGSASGGGVSAGAAGVSDLAVATDGTRIAMAWTQSAGGLTQVMLRELAGGALIERLGSASGNGASNAPYGASAPALAYFGEALHVAYVAPLLAGWPRAGILARRHDGTAWIESNGVESPAAGASGNLLSPRLAVGQGQLRLGWLDSRSTPALRSYAAFARFDGGGFVGDVGPASADGFDTTAGGFSFAVDSLGRPVASTVDAGQVRTVAGGAAVTRVFFADATTSVASILAANDLGPGDAIVIRGSVAGFTVAADDAGVMIVGERAAGATITSAVTVNAPDVQIANLTINGAIAATAGGISITNSTLTAATTVGGASVTFAGNTITGPVTVSTAGGGVIGGNTFGGATVTGLTIGAAFTGAVRGNVFNGMAVGILVSAANAPIGGNTFTGNTVGVRVNGAGIALGGAGLEPNDFRGNVTAVNLVGGGSVVRQSFVGNTTAVSGTGSVGGISATDANTFAANTTAVNVSGSTVRYNRFVQNGVAVVAGAGTRIFQNQISDSTGDGIRATGVRVTIAHNSVAVDGRAVDVTASAGEVEVRNNVLVSRAGHAIFVDTAGRNGFISDYNLLHAADGAHLVRWMGVDFDDLLDWQQDVARFDLHSQGRTLVDPSATRPRFAGVDALMAAPALAGRRAASPAADLGDPAADVGVTRDRTNLLANPGFDDAATPTGWTANATGTTLTTPLTPWEGARYFSTGATANGFAEQTINLLTTGFTASQLDTADLAAMFGARVRSAGATRVTLTFLNGANVAIGTLPQFNGSADGSRWELVGGRLLLPLGTRSIRLRIDGAANATAIDSAFLYVESGDLANDAGYGGGSSDDVGTAQPRIVLRSGDLYTDLIVNKPTVVRWDTYGNVNDRAVRIDLLKDDPASGPQFLLTIAAAAPDTGSFEFRPSDFGLTAGTGGYRFRVALVDEDVAFDRSTEASAIPEAGEDYYVDDRADTGDQYTPAATGSNRNTGKTPSAPKPLLTSVLRIYDLGADSVVHVDAGNYVHFHTAIISGTLGVGDDEGVTISGPTDAAKVATLAMGAPFAGFDLVDGDAVTLRNLRITGSTRGVDVRTNSNDFRGERLTVVSPTLQGVHLDPTAVGATLDGITVTGAGSHGIHAEVMIGSITNASVTGAAGSGIMASAGVGTISGSLLQSNQEGITVSQPTNTEGTVTSNRVHNNQRNGIFLAGNVQVIGNTVTGHTDPAYRGINIQGDPLAAARGNFLRGNHTGIYSTGGLIANNRVEGGTYGIESYDNSIVGNVVTGSATGIRLRNLNFSQHEAVRNNLLYGNTAVGILAEGGNNFTIENNTVDGGDAVGIQLVGSGSVVVRNNIVTVRNGRGVVVGNESQGGFNSNYNLFYVSGTGHVGTWQGANRTTFAAWRAATPGDSASQYGDPLFVNPAAGDYHEKSAHGGFAGGSLAPVLDATTGLPVIPAGAFVNDAVTSPAIDRGDPATPYDNEPPPNGSAANVGAFGNTPQASRSAATFVTVTSPNGGEQLPVGRRVGVTWLSHDRGGSVELTLLRAGAPVLAIAADTPNDGAYDWTIPADLAPGADYAVRVTRTDAPAATDASDATFIVLPAVNTFYVNDAAQIGDEFTAAPGTIDGSGLSSATPNLSIRYILDNYDLGPGDVIKVDAGTYNISTDLLIDAQDSGVTIEGPAWAAPAQPKVTVNRGNTTAGTSVFTSAGADEVTIRNLGLTGARYGVRLTATSDADDWTIDRVRIVGFAASGIGAGIDVDDGNDRLVVRGTTIVGPADSNAGIRVAASNALIEANAVSGASTFGISVTGVSNRVRDNTVSGAAILGIFANHPTNVLAVTPTMVSGNTVTLLVSSTGIQAGGQVTVQGNTVAAVANSVGISAQDRHTLVKGNSVTGGLHGINLSGEARAVGNTVQSAVNAINIFSGGWVVGNTVRSSTVGILVGSNSTPAANIANNLVVGNATGIQYTGNPTSLPSRFVNNTIVQTAGRGFVAANNSRNAWLRNNIFAISGNAAAIEVGAGAHVGFSSDYNLFHLSGAAAIVGLWQGVNYPTLSAWQLTLNQDLDGLAADPLFTNAAAGDYTLRPGSPGLDRGDPDTFFLAEPTLSGGRADLGASGNTPAALPSAARVVQVLDPNGQERYESDTAQSVKVRGFGLAQSDAIALIDVGSPTGTGQWLWDSGYAAPGGTPLTTSNINVIGVPDAAPAAVYNSFVLSSPTGWLRYELPVPDGAYTLRLHFAESGFIQPGQRVMDISVNGTLVADDFDILGGGTPRLRAKVLTFPVAAIGGAGIDVRLVSVAGGAVLSGIELLCGNPGGLATPAVDIAYAPDAANPAGGTYAPIASNVALDRYGRATVAWTTPAAGTTDARVKVASPDFPTVSDVSDHVFIVQAPATATDYYVNDAIVDANDVFTTAPGNDANSGASASSPMASLAALLARYTLGPGMVVHVDAGTYALPGTVVISAADAGVRIEGAGAARTTFNRNNSNSDAFQLANADGVQLDHFGITGGRVGVWADDASDSDDVLLENLRVFANHSIGVFIGGTNDRAVLRDSELYGVPGGATTDDQVTGVSVVGRDALVTGNDVHHSTRGITATGGGTAGATLADSNRVHHNAATGISVSGRSVARGNTVHDNAVTGIALSGFDAVAIDNTVYGTTGTGERWGITVDRGLASGNIVRNNANGILVGNGSAVGNTVHGNATYGLLIGQNATAVGNVVYANSVGIYQTASTSQYILQLVGNVSYGNTAAALEINSGGSAGELLRVYNNTFAADAGDAVRLTGAAAQVDLRNNVIAASAGYGINIFTTAQYRIGGDYNFYQITGAARVGRAGNVDSNSLLDWRSRTLLDKHSRIGDARFVGAGTGDFRVDPASPTIDAGDPDSPYALEPGAHGARVNIGHTGNAPDATPRATGPGGRTAAVLSPDGNERHEVGTTLTVRYRTHDPAAPAGTATAAPHRATVLSSSPAGYWNLDDAPGATTAADLSAGNRPGTYAAIGVTPGDPGRWDDSRSATFAGAGGGITIPHAPALEANRITVSAWLKPTQGIADNAAAVMKTLGTPGSWFAGYGMHYGATQGGGRINFFSNSYASGNVSAPIPLDQWTHVVGTFDGVTVRLFINGHLAAAKPAPTASASNQPLQIGAGPGAAPWKGGIDEVAVWGSALSDIAVAALYAAGHGPTAGRTVSLELTRDGAPDPVAVLATGLPLSGQFDWTIPANLALDGEYRIRAVYSDGVNSAADLSNSPFRVVSDGNTYYVNDGTTAGDAYMTALGNDDNSGKSPDKPMASLQALLDLYDLDPGDTVYVDAGHYPLPVNLVIGPGDSGVAVVGAGLDLTTLDRTNQGAGSYVFELLGGAGNVRLARMGMTRAWAGVYSPNGPATPDITVEDNAVYANQEYGILLDGDPNAVVRRNRAYGVPGGTALDNQKFGIQVAGGAANARITDNEVFDNGDTGIVVRSGGGLVSGNRVYRQPTGISAVQGSSTSPTLVVRNNEVFNNTVTGIAGSSDVLIVANRVYGQSAPDARGIAHGGVSLSGVVDNDVFGNFDGIVISPGSVATPITGNRVYANLRWGIDAASAHVLGNTVYSNQVGIVARGAQVEVSNNLVYANTNNGLQVIDTNNGPALVTGNTIYQDVGDVIQVINDAVNVQLFGNVLWTNAGRDIFVDPSSEQGFVSDNNLLHTGPAANAHIGFIGGTDRHALADWQSASGEDAASFTGDPRFVDIDGADNLLGYVAGADRGRDDNFHLRANSPAIDRGNDLRQPTLDHAGETRSDDPTVPNQGAGGGFADIGAFEFQGRSDDATRPTVVSTTPGGVHGGGTVGGPVSTITVAFSEALDALDARSPSVYELVAAGPDGNFGSGDDVNYPVLPQYTSLATNVTLAVTDAALPAGVYRLTIKGTPAGNSGLHDLAGNVLDGGGGANYVRVFMVADQTPPSVTSASLNRDAPGTYVSATFSEDVGPSLSTADVVLTNTTDATVGAIPAGQMRIDYDPDTRAAKITYLGAPNGALPDGRYTLTIRSDGVTDAAGNQLDGDRDGQAGGDYSLDFTVLGGDATGDGVVDFNDLAALAQNYNSPIDATWAQGDFNHDRRVDFNDLAILAQRYNRSLAPAGMPVTAATVALPAPPPALAIPAQSLSASVSDSTASSTDQRRSKPKARAPALIPGRASETAVTQQKTRHATATARPTFSTVPIRPPGAGGQARRAGPGFCTATGATPKR